MQLNSFRLGAMALACVVLLAAALPAPHAAAQTTDPAISAEHEAERLRIDDVVLDLVRHVGKDREREVRDLRASEEFSDSQDTLESQIAWIEEIESGDPRVMYETALRLRDGDGLPKHRDAAVTWFERAGDHGVPEGFFEASRMLLANPIREGDIWDSDELLRRAARRGVRRRRRNWGCTSQAAARALIAEVAAERMNTVTPTCGCCWLRRTAPMSATWMLPARNFFRTRSGKRPVPSWTGRLGEAFPGIGPALRAVRPRIGRNGAASHCVGRSASASYRF